MPLSRRQKMLASNSTEAEGLEEEEQTFNLMKMESSSVRGWWKVYYYDKNTRERKESVRLEAFT